MAVSWGWQGERCGRQGRQRGRLADKPERSQSKAGRIHQRDWTWSAGRDRVRQDSKNTRKF